MVRSTIVVNPLVGYTYPVSGTNIDMFLDWFSLNDFRDSGASDV